MSEERLTKQALFLEIRPSEFQFISSSSQPCYADAYIAHIEPHQCATLINELSKVLPLTESSKQSLDLSHLKRVKRTNLLENADVDNDASSHSNSKRKRPKAPDSVQLDVLLGAKSVVDATMMAPSGGDVVEAIQQRFKVQHVYQLAVPARPPLSQKEWGEFNERWPTTLFQERTEEFHEESCKLSDAECEQMLFGMNEAIEDSRASSSGSRAQAGVVVVDPVSGFVLSRAAEERRAQSVHASGPDNPLCMSIILAIQGISRREREAATVRGMESDCFQSGQYLCTGYDVYATMEPSVFEAMALVHARIRRLVMGCPAHYFRGGVVGLNVHALPGTNHHYRAFLIQPGTDLRKQCEEIHRRPSD